MNKVNAIEEVMKKPNAESVISTIKSRESVGNPKKGINLLSIVQKLTQKRAKAFEEGSSEVEPLVVT